MPRRFALSESELFADMPERLASHINGLLVEKKLARNETLFFKGDAGDGLYALVSGEIQISALSSGGRDQGFER